MASRDGIVLIDLHAKGRTKGKRWWARIWDRRMRRYTASRTFDTKEQARRWAVEQRGNQDKGLVQIGRPSLANLGSYWVTEMERSGKCQHHINRGKRLLQQLAEARIDDVTGPHFASDLTDWLKNLTAITTNRDGQVRRHKKELTSATKNRLLAFVKAMLHFAMKRGLLAIDPLRGVGNLPEVNKVKEVFSVAELRQILDDRHRQDPYWLAFALLIYTGMRSGEALHLRWEWIIVDSGVIKLGSHPDFPLKTHEERLVILQPELAALLTPIRKPMGWIIEDPIIRNASQKLRWSEFRRFLSRCDIQPLGRSPHSTRHSWVAMMLATGASVFDVKDWAGHRQLTTTDRYARERSSYRTSVSGWSPGILNLRGQCADTLVKRKLSANLSVADDQVVYEPPTTWASTIALSQPNGSPSGERDQTVG